MVKQTKIIPIYFTNGASATTSIDIFIGFTPKTMKLIASTDFATPSWITTSILNGQVGGLNACQFPIEWDLTNNAHINNTRQTFSIMTNTGVLVPGADVLLSVIFTD